MSLYLGLDSSTQSLTAVVLDVRGSDRSIAFQHALGFDRELPAYGTKHGVLPDADPRVALSSPLMWADALDRMMGIVATALGSDVRHVRAISGSAQQHGTVYLNASADATWTTLSSATPLAAQIGRIFSRERSPIWMDASTSTQCAAITLALGGAGRVADLTGSRAFERFAGPQIRKVFEQEPEAYARTAAIHLVSSYMASLLAGRHAPIDPGDGSGMNLMDIRSGTWAAAALDATAPGLAEKLPRVASSSTVVGTLSPYWTGRYGFPPAKVVAWSGDNPCSLIGTGLVEEGRIAISLGTSDTLFAFMREPRVDPRHVGHLFGSPTGDYMALICFANGSLARERIRDAYGLDWNGFSGALRTTRPGNGGAIMLPWFVPEITPPVRAPGVRRCDLDANDAAANVRAVVEAQMLSMAIHSEWTGIRARTIHATGGASVNREILRIMADVHDADVYQLDVPASATVGAALRAFHADEASEGRQIPWRDIVAGVAEPVASTRIAPVAQNVRVYVEMKRKYARCEADALA
jgi:xylulokinase